MLSRLTFAALTLFVAGVFLYTGATQAQGQDAKVLSKGAFHKADKAGSGTASPAVIRECRSPYSSAALHTRHGCCILDASTRFIARCPFATLSNVRTGTGKPYQRGLCPTL